MKYVDIRDGWYGIVTTDKDGKEVNFSHIGRAITLVQILMSVETDEITWRLNFEYHRQTVSVEFERGDIINKTALAPLIAKGADILPKNSEIAIKSIMIQEQTADVLGIYDNVGWITLKSGSIENLAYRSDVLVGDTGRYIGKYKLEKMGNFEAWREMIINDVLGRPALEIILLASLSAIINGLIAPETTGENPVFHISGISGSGKSTAGYLAASVYGEPYEGAKTVIDEDGIKRKKNSVFGSWYSTENALITDICGNQGICVILNEIGKLVCKDLTSIVYGFSDGVDKNRLTQQYKGSIKENFCTSIISIGETSLIEKCLTKIEGVKMRVMEINDMLTDDAEHSSRLKECSRRNNGWAAEILSQHILDIGGKNKVISAYKAAKKKLCKGILDAQKYRFTEKFTALLVTTAAIASDAFDIHFNTQEVIDFCNKHWETRIEESGDVDESYNEFLEYLKINRNKFFDKTNIDIVPQEVWGEIKHPNRIEGNKVLITEYNVRPSIAEGILKKLKYDNPITCFKKWKDLGVLNNEVGKLKNRRRILGSSKDEYVYVIQEWEEKK